MYVVYSLVAHPQSAELVHPCQGSLDNPPVHAQPTSMPGAPLRDYRCDVARTQRIPMLPGIISPVPIQPLRSAARTAAFAPYRRYRIHQWQQLSYVMTVGSGQNCRQRSPIGAGDHVMLTPGLAAVRRIRACSPPPPTARTDALSTQTWDQSRPSAPCSLDNRSSWRLCHTPASCHSFRRRQQVIPDPHSISLGNISQGMPLLSTKRMPVSAFRSSMRGVRGTGTAWASRVAEVVGVSPIVHRSPVVSPSASPCPVADTAPVRCNQRLGENIGVFQMLVNSFC